MSLTYNAESNTYEREGYEPVSKEDVMWYIETAPAGPEEIQEDAAAKMDFIQSVKNGVPNIIDGNALFQFLRWCTIYDAGLELATLFLISEKDPEIVEEYVTNRLFSFFKYPLIIQGGGVYPSDEKRSQLVMWFFMLGSQDPALINRRASIFASYIFSHSDSYWHKLSERFVRTPRLWATLFHFADILNPANDKIGNMLYTTLSWTVKSKVVYSTAMSSRLRLYVSGEYAKYLTGFTLFDRLWRLLRNSKFPNTSNSGKSLAASVLSVCLRNLTGVGPKVDCKSQRLIIF